MITLRRALIGDCRRIFIWRNHADVRKHFFEPREISYGEHKEWFQDSLHNENRIILIAHEDGEAVGVIRYDIASSDSETAEIDIFVAPDRHRQGLGKQILIEGEKWVKGNTKVKNLIARVKEENIVSHRMFRAHGFVPEYVFFKKGLRDE